MPDEPVTLGEVYRRLISIEHRIDVGNEQVQRQISESSKSYVHIDRYLAERQATGERIGALEADVNEIRADTKWLRRTILLAVAGFVVNICVGVIVLLIGIGIRG